MLFVYIPRAVVYQITSGQMPCQMHITFLRTACSVFISVQNSSTGQSGLKLPKLLMVNPGTVPVTNGDTSGLSIGSCSGVGANTGVRTASTSQVVSAATTPSTASSSVANNRYSNVGISAQSAVSSAPMIVILTTPASTSSVASNTGSTPQVCTQHSQSTTNGQGVVLRFLPYRR